MNFLGHAVLSFGDPEILVGNVIGDYVKGRKKLEEFPRKVKVGLLLHRKIDEYTDKHPQVLKSKIYYRPAYRLYAGACVDHLYDHFLANDPQYFPSTEHLLNFEEKVHKVLEAHHDILPPYFQNMQPYMKKGKWLSDVKKIKGLERSFLRLERKAKYIDSIEEAYRTSVGHYYELNQRFVDFMEDVTNFAEGMKNQLLEENQ